MTTDTLEQPATSAELAATHIAASPGNLKATALASFVAIRSHAATLAEKYRAVAYDVTTTKGMTAAKDARLELREQGRFAVQRLRDRLKDEANDLKRVVSEEAEAVIKIIAPVEDAIHAQITAEEDRKKAEKAERERIAAERAQKQADDLATIRGWLTTAQTPGMTAERLAIGIEALAALTFPADQHLDPVALADAQCQTLQGMRQHHALLVEREAEAARLQAQREEQERQAAELRRQAEELAAAKAELQRQADALAAAKAAQEAAARAEREAQERAARDAAPAMQAEQDANARDAGQSEATPEVASTGTAETLGHEAEAAPNPLPQPDVAPQNHQLPEADAAPGVGTEEAPAVESAPVDPLQALLTHLHKGIDGDRFPNHPKPAKAWWDDLKALMAALEGA